MLFSIESYRFYMEFETASVKISSKSAPKFWFHCIAKKGPLIKVATDTDLAGYPAAGYPPYIFAGYPVSG